MITASLIAIAHVAGTLAAVVVAVFLAVAVVCAFGAIAGCVLSSRASAAEECGKIAGFPHTPVNSLRPSRETSERIRVESYPTPPPIAVLPTLTADPPLPQIGNPLTNRWMTPEIRQ